MRSRHEREYARPGRVTARRVRRAGWSSRTGVRALRGRAALADHHRLGRGARRRPRLPARAGRLRGGPAQRHRPLRRAGRPDAGTGAAAVRIVGGDRHGRGGAQPARALARRRRGAAARGRRGQSDARHPRRRAAAERAAPGRALARARHDDRHLPVPRVGPEPRRALQRGARLRRDTAAAVGRHHAGHLRRRPGPAGAVGRDRQGAAVDGGGDDPDDPRHRRPVLPLGRRPARDARDRRPRLRRRDPRARLDGRADGQRRPERDRAGPRRAAARARHGLHGLLHGRDATTAAARRHPAGGGAVGDRPGRAARVRRRHARHRRGAVAAGGQAALLPRVRARPRGRSARRDPRVPHARARAHGRGGTVAVRLPRARSRRARRQAPSPSIRRRARGGSSRRLPTAKPVAALVVVACVGLLVVAALGARTISLSVSFIPSLPPGSEPRQIADEAAEGFAPGILAPTELLLESPGIGGQLDALARLQALYAREPGVAAVLGPAQTGRDAPVGVVTSRDGGAARLVMVLRDEPTSSAAIATIRRLERRTPQLLGQAGLPRGTHASYAGESALSAETVDALVRDLRRVVVVTAILTFVLLALFLRALLAPVLLLAGSVLAFAGSFGLMSLLLPSVLGTHDVVYYVPLVAAVMLVGPGQRLQRLHRGAHPRRDAPPELPRRGGGGHELRIPHDHGRRRDARRDVRAAGARAAAAVPRARAAHVARRPRRRAPRALRAHPGAHRAVRARVVVAAGADAAARRARARRRTPPGRARPRRPRRGGSRRPWRRRRRRPRRAGRPSCRPRAPPGSRARAPRRPAGTC